MPTPAGVVDPRSPQLFVAKSAPVMPVREPPEPALPSPTTVKLPVDELKPFRMMPFVPPFAATLLKTKLPLPPPDNCTAAALVVLTLHEVLMETSLAVAGNDDAPTRKPVPVVEATRPCAQLLVPGLMVTPRTTLLLVLVAPIVTVP